jgi:nitrite reductase/ring-hydroxylating ferredoxin subunit
MPAVVLNLAVGEYYLGACVGIDPMTGETNWHDVAAADRVRRVAMLEVEAAGRALLLLAVADLIHAVDAVCPHHQAWLSMGQLDGDCIDCPRHQGRFHIPTGAQLRGPACPALGVYPVREAAGRVLVALPA